jgi:hypothetical protein
MVVDFLEQLCKAIPTMEGEDEDGLRKKTKTPRKIKLILADRKKPCNDDDGGCACISSFHLSMSPISWLQGIRYPRTFFPGENERKHPTFR